MFLCVTVTRHKLRVVGPQVLHLIASVIPGLMHTATKIVGLFSLFTGSCETNLTYFVLNLNFEVHAQKFWQHMISHFLCHNITAQVCIGHR